MLEIGLHIVADSHVAPLLSQCRGALAQARALHVSAPADAAAMVGKTLTELSPPLPHRVLSTDNAAHDWSGYLALLRAAGTGRLLLANDSLLTRRRFTRAEVGRVARLTAAAAGPALIGEIDQGAQTLMVNGAPSRTWVSTALFGLVREDARTLAALADRIEGAAQVIPDDLRHAFTAYLAARRPETLGPGGQPPEGKLRAMLMERLLDIEAAHAGAKRHDPFAGRPGRRLRKWLEDRPPRRS